MSIRFLSKLSPAPIRNQLQVRLKSTQSASSFLFDEAAREAEELKNPKPRVTRATEAVEQKGFSRFTKQSSAVEVEEGWKGDELQSQLIRRVMEDSAPKAMKLKKKSAPELTPLPSTLFASPSTATQTTFTTPADPTTPTKPLEPWEFKFKAPEGYKPVPISIVSTSPDFSIRKRPELSSLRAARVRDEALDYETGFGSGMRSRVYVPEEGGEFDTEGVTTSSRSAGLGGSGMRSWTGIVDDKIDKARQAGAFKNVKGRYKPIVKDGFEENPYVSREDFLINRMIKNQGAAPIWIELGKDYQVAYSDFKTSLRESWSRRTIRMKSLDYVSNSTLSDMPGWRDMEWEARERAYHLVAVKSLNDIISKFNYVAPYTVRKPKLMLEPELLSCFRDSVPFIVAALKKRKEGFTDTALKAKENGERLEKKFDGVEDPAVEESAWKAFTRAVNQVFAKA